MHLTDVQSFCKQTPGRHRIHLRQILRHRVGDASDQALSRARRLTVVSLQNCINEERIAAIVGWGKTLGCIASLIAAELYAPGHVKRTVPMGGDEHTVFRVGEVHGRVTPRAQEVVELLRSADSGKVTTNLWGERWSKLSNKFNA